MSCIECNKIISIPIQYENENNIDFNASIQLRIVGVFNLDSGGVPSDGNERFYTDEGLELFQHPSVCNQGITDQRNNLNQYYSLINGVHSLRYTYLQVGGSFTMGMLAFAHSPINGINDSNRFMYVKSPTITLNRYFSAHGTPYNHGYNSSQNNIIRFPFLYYTDNNFNLRTDIVTDTVANVFRLPAVDGGFLFGAINSDFSKSWWVYLEAGHRRCTMITCVPQVFGSITPSNYNQPDAFCGFYGYAFELNREEMNQVFETGVAYNPSTVYLSYSNLNYDFTGFPDSKFNKFRLRYKIKRRMTCHGETTGCSGSPLGKTGPGSESCIMYYTSGIMTLESNDEIKFTFDDDNKVRFSYGSYNHVYDQPHNQDYVTFIFHKLSNSPKPIIAYCPPLFTQGTRPIYLVPNRTQLNGMNVKIESNYPFIKGNNPFLSFPRLNRV